MEKLFSLPAHPLLVHIPVVLLPLAALCAVLIAGRTAWFERFKWAVLALAGAGAIGGILAVESGEKLAATASVEDQIAIASHQEMGETARTMGVLFFFAVLAWVLIPVLLKRRGGDVKTAKIAKIALTAVVVLTAIGSVYWIVKTGHSGATRAWEDFGKE